MSLLISRYPLKTPLSIPPKNDYFPPPIRKKVFLIHSQFSPPLFPKKSLTITSKSSKSNYTPNSSKKPVSSSFSGNFPEKTMGKIGILDLEKQFAFYGAYHRNPTNVLIHMMFVWPILFTAGVILYFTPALFDFPFDFKLGLVPNIGFVFTVIYSIFYICMDKKAGSLAAIMCFASWVFGSLLAQRLGYSLAWKVVLAAQLFCWTGQFIGHGVFEKRAPALLDNLTQAFLMAPFFVLLEALQSSFGYEPYEGFHASVKAKIDTEIKKFQDQKAKKSS